MSIPSKRLFTITNSGVYPVVELTNEEAAKIHSNLGNMPRLKAELKPIEELKSDLLKDKKSDIDIFQEAEQIESNPKTGGKK